MDSIDVCTVQVPRGRGRSPVEHFKSRLYRSTAHLSPKSKAVLDCQGINRLYDIVDQYGETYISVECSQDRRESEKITTVVFGDVSHSHFFESIRKLQNKDIAKLELQKIFKVCYIKPLQISGKVGVSDEITKVVRNFGDKPDVAYIMQKPRCLNYYPTRFEIFDILRRNGVKCDNLWITNDLTDEALYDMYVAQAFPMISDALRRLRINTERFLFELTDRNNIQDIVNSVCDETCSYKHISHISRSIKLTNETDHEYVGSVQNAPYTTRRHWIIKQLREQLIDGIMKELSVSISKEVKTRFDTFMRGLVHVEHALNPKTIEMIKALLPDDMFVGEIQHVVLFILNVVKNLLVSVFMVFVSFFIPVNINSEEWRNKIAEDISEAVWKQRGDIAKEVTDKIGAKLVDLQTEVKPELHAVFRDLSSVVPAKDQLLAVCKSELLTYSELDYHQEESHWNACKAVLGDLSSDRPVEIYPAITNGTKVIVSVLPNVDGKSQQKFAFGKEEFGLLFKKYGEKSIEVQRINQYKQSKKITVDHQRQRLAKRIINEKGEKFMMLHSNLTSIGVSSVISKNNGENITEGTCIVFYCTCKGLIPLAESAFPTRIDEIPVDVREGFAMPAVGGAGYCNPLSFGCSIGLQGRPSGGSLGLFLQEKNNTNAHGFLTCFHVLLDVDQSGNDSSIYTGGGHPVIQPSQPDIEQWNRNQCAMNDIEMRDESSATTPDCENIPDCLSHISDTDAVCGYLRNAFHGNVMVNITDTEMDAFGVDVAYVQITTRDPQKACFPDISNNLRRVFQREEVNIGGIVDEIYEDHASFVVYKYGKTTGLTRGVFDGSGSLLRMKMGCAFRCMKNLYEVMSTADNAFFHLGDSGSAVFQEVNKKLYCIGLGVAMSDIESSRCFVTPIKAVMTALSTSVPCCPDLEMRDFI